MAASQFPGEVAGEQLLVARRCWVTRIGARLRRGVRERLTEPAGHDLVGVLGDQHRFAEQLGAELGEEPDGLHLAGDVVRVRSAAHLCDDTNRLDQFVAFPLSLEGELVRVELRVAGVEPAIEDLLRKNTRFLPSAL